MSEFKELIKSFAKTREYVRDFFVYGFKSREDFKEKSSRTYDNERRRIESWLSGFIRQDYTPKGKNISLAIDSNLLDCNPLYSVWKTKSFTDNDIMLHFYLLDYLDDTDGKTVEEITDGILTSYEVEFDSQMVRRKCNHYAQEGLLIKKKSGKELRYRKSADSSQIFAKFPALSDAVQFYQLTSPLGIVGNTILDNISRKNTLFRVKHTFFVHTLEDEILLSLLDAMKTQSAIVIQLKSTRNGKDSVQRVVPLQIFVSTRTGRRFLCAYLEETRRFCCFRLDAIKSVQTLDAVPHYDALRERLQRNHRYAWGVSFQGGNGRRTEHLKLTLRICEDSEDFILERLKREGKDGTITRIAEHTFTYETEVFDTNEMLPWIRTFTGRILDIECDNPRIRTLLLHDMEQLYKMYNI